MATRNFSTMATRISPSAPGCPTPVLTQYIRRAAIEVCERTLVWRHVMGSLDLTAGQYSYTYAAPAQIPADTDVHAVIKATINDKSIAPITAEQAAARYPYWPTTDTAYRSQPQHYVHFTQNTFHMAPTPDATTTYTLDMVLALKPSDTAAGMEEDVFNDVEDAILHGALQHLLVLPERTWSDREAAAYHARQFTFKVSERRARANLGAGRASLTVRQVPLA